MCAPCKNNWYVLIVLTIHLGLEKPLSLLCALKMWTFQIIGVLKQHASCFSYPVMFWWDFTVLACCVNICISITAGLFVNQGVSEAWKEMIEVKRDFFRNASLYLTACEKFYVAMVTPPSTNDLATLSDFSTWWKRIFTLMSRVYEQKGEIVSKQTRRWRRLSFWPFFLYKVCLLGYFFSRMPSGCSVRHYLKFTPWKIFPFGIDTQQRGGRELRMTFPLIKTAREFLLYGAGLLCTMQLLHCVAGDVIRWWRDILFLQLTWSWPRLPLVTTFQVCTA